MRTRGVLCYAAVVSCAPLAALAGTSAEFWSIGSLNPPTDPPGSAAYGVSPEGDRIVGSSWTGGGESLHLVPVRWSIAEGLVGLPIPQDALPDAVATRVSALGNVAVGSNGFSLGFDSYEPRNAAVWLNAVDAPDPVVMVLGYLAQDVTADGSMVAGVTRFPGPWPVPDQAFRWTEASGIEELGHMPGGSYSWGAAISDDGETVVGFGDHNGVLSAFRWTSASGMQPLVNEIPDFPSSAAYAVSSDGSIVVGSYQSSLARWVDGDQQILGTPFGGIGAGSPTGWMDTSADGSVVVATFAFQDENFDFFFRPYIWTEAGGLQDLQELLGGVYQLDLAGWTLEGIGGISHDGLTLAGWGTNPDGWTEGWVVRLPAEPPPCAGDLTGDGVVASDDLNILLAAFGQSGSGDVDGDADTDSADLNILLAGFGQECG